MNSFTEGFMVLFVAFSRLFDLERGGICGEGK
jgi:hypothetical protein